MGKFEESDGCCIWSTECCYVKVCKREKKKTKGSVMILCGEEHCITCARGLIWMVMQNVNGTCPMAFVDSVFIIVNRIKPEQLLEWELR